MAIEILETMDECVVATKAAQMLHRASEKAKKKFSSSAGSTASANTGSLTPAQGHEMLHLNQYWGPLNFVGNEMDLDLDLSFFQLADWDGGGSLLPSIGETGLES